MHNVIAITLIPMSVLFSITDTGFFPGEWGKDSSSSMKACW